MRPRPPEWKTIRRLAETLAIGAVGGILFQSLGLPAGLVSGSIVAASIGSLLGRPLAVPHDLTRVILVVVGIAPGTTTAGIEITRLVRRGIQLMGSYGSRVRTDMPDVLGLAAHGRVSPSRPITRRYRLEQADDAYAALSRGEIVGRAIVTMS